MTLKGMFFYTKPWKKLLLLLWLLCVSFIITYVVSITSAFFIFGNKVFDASFINELSSDSSSLFILKYLQVFNSLGLFLLPSILIGWLTYGSIKDYFRLNFNFSILKVFLVAILAFSLLPISNFLAEINHSITFPSFLADFENYLRLAEKNSEQLTQTFINADNLQILALNIFVIAVIPAFAEEFFFRGALQRIFVEWFKNIHWGIIITAIIFSAVHMQFFTFIPRFFLGLVFGYMLEYSKTLWLPIVAHFINNAAAVTVYYLINKNIIPQETEKIGNSQSFMWLLMAIIISAVLLYLILINKNVSRKCVE